jgi:CRISPR-associated protein (TIGR03984 family)
MSPPIGCDITSLDDTECRAWIDWVLGKQATPGAFSQPTWLLAHCHAGVTWGRLEDGQWRLASGAFPDLCPHPEAMTIQEFRIFSPAEEVLIWRVAFGLRGRILRDRDLATTDELTRPEDEERVLLAGQLIEQKHGFSRVGDGTGAEQALPVVVNGEPPKPWPRLVVRHYFARDAETGVVRVVVTRLKEVR